MTTAAIDDPTLWNVVEEHLDEADFLVERWLNTSRSALLTLPDLHRAIEGRLLAHLDGLATGGAVVADRLLWPALGPESEASASRVAAAVLALLLEPVPLSPAWSDPLARVLDVLRAPSLPAVHQGLATAFRITPRSDIDEPLRQALYAVGEPTVQVAVLTALAARGVNVGPILPTLLRQDEVPVLVAALQASTSGDRGPVRHLIEGYLEHPDATVRDEALRAGLILNLHPAWRACTLEARRGAPRAMLALALFGGPAELDLLASLARSGMHELHRRAAVRALGASGRADAVEACVPLLTDSNPKIAALALEAIATVTDLPWTQAPFSAPAPDEAADDDALPPLEEDLETDLMPADDDELPVPNPAEVARWWSENRGRFRGDNRFLTGLPLSPSTLGQVLLACPLRRLGAMALDVAVRSSGRAQIPALRLLFAAPELPSDLRLTRPPVWS